ncbi:MAG: phosphatidate cytidylyltransferase [Marinibacterium sp.]|nr:phosphatidate cytidylyltransferase [Marinibacterium sp.]
MTETRRWNDLASRLGSGAVLIAAGMGAVIWGGLPFDLFVSLCAGLMVWELARMLDPQSPGTALQLGLLSGCAVMVSVYIPAAFAMPILIAPALVGIGQLDQNKGLFALYMVAITLAAYGIMSMREDFGFVWMLWLVSVVVATDVAGYFAGKAIGGPRFLPKISPNKTWAGTSAGWVASALVGVAFMIAQGTGLGLVMVSIAVSMAGQMGDFTESAIKRHAGVKDASALIPGHGGLMDRFDGLIAASLFILLTAQLTGYPPVVID